jgi:glycosyltransferase involved in cell wall biosynthesis
MTSHEQDTAPAVESRKRRFSLLIFIHVPIQRIGDKFYIEPQACNGLRLWQENFGDLNVLAIESADIGILKAAIDESNRIDTKKINITLLPNSYRLDRFIKNYARSVEIIKNSIESSHYLCFSIGGLFGDWGSVACWQAHRMNRPYAVWTDRVESEVVRRLSHEGSWRRRLRAWLTHRPMAWLERAVIGRATLGLFHGQDTFAAYSPHCRHSELVHNIHISKSTHIDDASMSRKLERAKSGVLKIGYVGRAEPMKGPEDWITVLRILKHKNIPFTARWLGEGSSFEKMKLLTKEHGLTDVLELPGFIRDKNAIMSALRDMDIFMFCHKTPESPRVLIEAMVSGCALLGYDSAYARDLTHQHGGGVYAPIGDVDRLAREVEALHERRDALAALMSAARADGAPFDDASVFKHRSDILKKYLNVPEASSGR